MVFTDTARSSSQIALHPTQDLNRFVHLLIHAGVQEDRVNFHDNIRRDSLAFEAIAFRRVPAEDWQAHPVSTADLEIRCPQNVSGSLFADDSCKAMLGGEPDHHFCCAICPFVHEYDNVAMKGLRAQALG